MAQITFHDLPQSSSLFPLQTAWKSMKTRHFAVFGGFLISMELDATHVIGGLILGGLYLETQLSS
jgi:hypothetical protein